MFLAKVCSIFSPVNIFDWYFKTSKLHFFDICRALQIVVWYLMMDLENVVDKVLKKDYPMYFDILVYKIDGKQNLEIQ